MGGDSGLRNPCSVALGESSADGACADAVMFGDCFQGPTLTTLATNPLRLVFGQPENDDHGECDQDRHPRQKACDGHEVQL